MDQGEGGTLGSVGTTEEVFATEQVVGGDIDPIQEDISFDVGAEVRHHKAQRAETTKQPTEDTDLPMADVDPSVPFSTYEIMRRLRLQVQDLKVSSAHWEERYLEANRQRTELHGEVQRLQVEVIHQTSRSTYYVSTYYTTAPLAQRVPSYSQYMIASEGARAPRAGAVPDAPPQPPPGGEDQADS